MIKFIKKYLLIIIIVLLLLTTGCTTTNSGNGTDNGNGQGPNSGTTPTKRDTYLKNEYGDYMKIPDGAAEKGFTHLANWSIEFLDEQEKQ